MSLPKWNLKDLMWAKSDGYKVCPCSCEDEAKEIKNTLKVNGRCAQAGVYKKDSGKEKYFVITRERRQ